MAVTYGMIVKHNTHEMTVLYGCNVLNLCSICTDYLTAFLHLFVHTIRNKIGIVKQEKLRYEGLKHHDQ